MKESLLQITIMNKIMIIIIILIILIILVIIILLITGVYKLYFTLTMLPFDLLMYICV